MYFLCIRFSDFFMFRLVNLSILCVYVCTRASANEYVCVYVCVRTRKYVCVFVSCVLSIINLDEELFTSEMTYSSPSRLDTNCSVGDVFFFSKEHS